MALSVPRAPGVSQMLKDGARVSITFMKKPKITVFCVYFIEKINFKKSCMLGCVFNAMTHVRF